MELGLAGKVALVAGASRGLGRAVAKGEAGSGAFSRPKTLQNLLSISR